MKAALRATALLSGTSLLSILVQVVAAKGRAELIGPEGLGLNVLLLNVVAVAVMLAGFGVSTGLVREVPAALAGGDPARAEALRRASWLIRLGFAAAAITVLAVFRMPIARVMLGGEANATNLVIILAAVLLTLLYDVESSLLAAHHRVGPLARLGVANSVVSAAVGLGILAAFRSRGIAPAVVASAVVSWVLATLFVRRHIGRARVRPQNAQVRREARTLLGFGGPYTASQLVGAGTGLVVPVMTLHMLGTRQVAFYQASMAIAVTYLGFLLSAMGNDYFPRVSAAKHDPRRLGEMINEQQRLVTLISTPLILGVLVFAPYVIPLVYTHDFAPAAAMLEWMVVGDVFKFASWTISYVVLARSRPAVYFGLELFGGASYLLCSYLGVRAFGLQGLGIGWLVGYALYFAVCALLARRDLRLHWSADNLRWGAAALVAALAVRVAATAGTAPRLLLGVPLLGLASWLCLRALARVAGGDLRSLLRRVRRRGAAAQPAVARP